MLSPYSSWKITASCSVFFERLPFNFIWILLDLQKHQAMMYIFDLFGDKTSRWEIIPYMKPVWFYDLVGSRILLSDWRDKFPCTKKTHPFLTDAAALKTSRNRKKQMKVPTQQTNSESKETLFIWFKASLLLASLLLEKSQTTCVWHPKRSQRWWHSLGKWCCWHCWLPWRRSRVKRCQCPKQWWFLDVFCFSSKKKSWESRGPATPLRNKALLRGC